MSAIASFCEDFSKPRGGPKIRRRTKPLPAITVAMDDARRRAMTGDWTGSKGSTLVGLYAICHKMIYGVVPDELYHAATMRAASRLAASSLHVVFRDEASEAVAFIRWSWEREKRKNAWASQKGFDRSRLGWKFQFSRSLFTDYRVHRQTRR